MSLSYRTWIIASLVVAAGAANLYPWVASQAPDSKIDANYGALAARPDVQPVRTGDTGTPLTPVSPAAPVVAGGTPAAQTAGSVPSNPQAASVTLSAAAPAAAPQIAPAPIAPAQSAPAPQVSNACNVDACTARYRSFSAADCTYQPTDGPRRLCTVSSSGSTAQARTPEPQAARKPSREEELRNVERAVRRLTEGETRRSIVVLP